MELFDPGNTTVYLIKIVKNCYRLNAFLPKWAGGTRQSISQERAEGLHELERLQEKLFSINDSRKIVLKLVAEEKTVRNINKYFIGEEIHLLVSLQDSNVSANEHWEDQTYHQFISQIQSPVLSIINYTPASHNRSILIPVTSFVPVKKIRIAQDIAKRFHARIHIVTILDSTKTNIKQSTEAFYRTYKLLSESGHTPEYKILTGTQNSETLMRHAAQIKAGILLWDNRKETFSIQNLNQKIKNWLYPLKGIQIFTMKPMFTTPA